MRVLSLLFILGAVACSRAEPSPTPTAERAAPSAQSGAAGLGAPLVLARGVRFVEAADGDATKVVRAERERALAEGRDLVVYVGAKWCEPCQRFHAAAERGELDELFPDLTVLAFDLDEDRDRVVAAGYESQLIPLFVVPGADGRASKRRFEGGIKGDRAVSNLAPRLQKLLAK